MEDGRGWEEEAGRGETTHKASWCLVKTSTELQHFGIADNTVNKKGNRLKKGDCVHNPGLFITPSLADGFLNKHSFFFFPFFFTEPSKTIWPNTKLY